MKLSPKKRQQLHDAVHGAVMDVRTKVWLMPHQEKTEFAIDEILAQLCIDAPKKAVEAVEKKI